MFPARVHIFPSEFSLLRKFDVSRKTIFELEPPLRSSTFLKSLETREFILRNSVASPFLHMIKSGTVRGGIGCDTICISHETGSCVISYLFFFILLLLLGFISLCEYYRYLCKSLLQI